MKRQIVAAVGAIVALAAVGADKSGRLSDSISWEITDSVLTVSGSGAMPSYAPAKLSGNPFQDERLAYGVHTIVIGEGVTEVGDFAFGSRGNVKGARVMRVGAAEAFSPLQSEYVCDGSPLYANVRSVVLPSTLKKVGQFAFTRVPITSVALPEGLEEIGYSAFANTGLRSLKLPQSLRRVGPEAFSTCLNLVAVDLNGLDLTLSNGCFFNCENLRMILHSGNVGGLSESTFRATSFESFREAELLAMLRSDGLENYLKANMPNRDTFAGTPEAYDARMARTVRAFYQNEATNAAVMFKLDDFRLLPYDEESGTCRVSSTNHGDMLIASDGATAALLRENWEQAVADMQPSYFTGNGSVRLQSVAFPLPDGRTLAASVLAR